MDDKILIIGAGVSGLAAAQELQSHGKQVLVIEAQDRIGGRVKTQAIQTKNTNTQVDVGAAFIHGVVGNPLYEILVQAKIPTTTMSHCRLYQENGKPAKEDLDTRMEKLFNHILDKATETRQRNRHHPGTASTSQRLRTHDISLGEAMDRMVERLDKNFTAQEEQLYHWHRTNLEFANATSLYKLSNMFWDQDDAYEMHGEHVAINGGFTKLTELLSKGIEVKLNTPIVAIDYSSTQVTLTASSGELFRAKAVLVTVPLGVLKKRMIEFNPALPIEKQMAIDALGYGLINKVIVGFARKFWKEKEFLGYAGYPSNPYFMFINVTATCKQPILVAIVTSDFARDMEKLTDDEILDQVMQTIRTIYPRAPDPLDCIVTRWGSERYALGSYSYIPVGAVAYDYDLVAEPLYGKDADGNPTNDPKVTFAGEGTIRNFPATVHGAFYSGIREARRLAHVPDYDARPLPYSFSLGNARARVGPASSKSIWTGKQDKKSTRGAKPVSSRSRKSLSSYRNCRRSRRVARRARAPTNTTA